MNLTVSLGPPMAGCCHFFAENQGLPRVDARCNLQNLGCKVGWIYFGFFVVARGDAGGGLRRHAQYWCIGAPSSAKPLLCAASFDRSHLPGLCHLANFCSATLCLTLES